MASIVDWLTAGVALKVDVATNPGVVLGGALTELPFSAGGNNGVPSGFSDWQSNVAGDPATITRQVDADGIFYIGNATLPSGNISFGAQYEMEAIPDRRYFLRVSVRQSVNYPGAFITYIREYNPTTDHERTIGAINNYTDDAWRVVNTFTTRAVDYANGYTRIRFVIAGSRTALQTNDDSWGIRYRRMEILARDEVMPEPVWRDITCDVKELTTRYGRSRFTERYDTATINLVLLNEDGEYSYRDPHPFAFGPGRQVRVEATYDGVTYPFAYGLIDNLNDSMDLDGHAVTNVSCVDVTSVMAQSLVPEMPWAPPLSPPYLTGQRIGFLASDYIGYPYLLLDAGQWTTRRIQASGRTVRDEIGLTSDSEGGNVFADRAGNIVYKDRTWPDVDVNLKEVTANFEARIINDQIPFDGVPNRPDAPTFCPNDVVTEWGLARVVNTVELAAEDGGASLYEDTESIREFGPRTYQRMDFLLSAASGPGGTTPILDAWLDQRAADIMTGYTQPKLRLNTLSYRPDIDGHDWVWTLSAFLNWLVRVWYQNAKTGWGWLIVTRVQSIEHRITPLEWAVTLTVDQPVAHVYAPVMLQAVWDGELSTGHDGWDIGRWS